MIKKTIRNLILENRSNLGKDIHKSYSETIVDKIFSSSFYENAKLIMTFISFGNEVDTHNFIKKSLSDGKRIAVPITFPKTREIKPSEILDFDELEVGYYNILTPKDKYIRYINPKEIDLAIVPGVAFDRDGYRVGYGGGYYDRFLSQYPDIIKLGIAFDLQIIDKIPKEDFDIAVDMIFTEKEIITCKL
ncbi:MAG TPA: 5-formyltetrahydrofolate cyclo-ligase [Tissierellaceae bacterium]|nr:5-formyltetrahydrofolate cyclo-ligase [Tissierellaceae bacterium]